MTKIDFSEYISNDFRLNSTVNYKLPIVSHEKRYPITFTPQRCNLIFSPELTLKSRDLFISVRQEAFKVVNKDYPYLDCNNENTLTRAIVRIINKFFINIDVHSDLFTKVASTLIDMFEEELEKTKQRIVKVTTQTTP